MQEYTHQGGQHGLEHLASLEYSQQILQFAKRGLPASEQKYLLPFEDMLASKKNIASEILEVMGHDGPYTEKESAKPIKYMWKRQIQGMQFLNEAYHV